MEEKDEGENKKSGMKESERGVEEKVESEGKERDEQ